MNTKGVALTAKRIKRTRRSSAARSAIPESEIQDALEGLVERGAFHHAIQGKEEIARGLDALKNEFILPAFPIDYVIRKRFLVAAVSVLKRLENVRVISTAKTNISWAKRDRLFPDLLLCNDDMGLFTAVEVKGSRQTEREAVTELLGYEHEVRNHLPFSSNSDVSLVIVSTEYAPLLSHSIATLAVWQRKDVLCLKAKRIGRQIRFSVYLPDPWTAIGQRSLAGDAWMTTTLSLYCEDSEKARIALEGVLLPAASLIARESERSSSNGFLLLWEDSWFPRLTGTPFNLTIGWINPYAFLPKALREGFAPVPSEPFERLLADGSFTSLGEAYKPIYNAAENGVRLLELHCKPRWEGATTWESERLGPNKLRNRALPLHMDFWGLVGDYMREVFVHPAARKHYMPELTRNALDVGDVVVGLPLLDDISGLALCQNGRFTCHDLLWLGIRFGTLQSLCKMPAEKGEEQTARNIMALYLWTLLDLIPPLREMQERQKGTNDIKKPAPTLTLRSYTKRSASATETEAFIHWVNDEFIGSGHPTHQEFFLFGVTHYPLFEPVFKEPAEVLVRLRAEAVEFSRNWLRMIAVELIPDLIDGKQRKAMASMLKKLYEISLTDAQAKVSTVRAIDNVAPETHLLQLGHGLPRMVDLLVDDLTHSVKELESGANVDWSWLKEQIAKLREQGVEYPAISVGQDGGISTVIIEPKIGRAFGAIDPKNQVVFVNHLSGVPVITVELWEDLERGVPWRQGAAL